MALTGDLCSIDLANVFQMLLLSQKTGTLEVRSRGARNEVYLDGDAVLCPYDEEAFPAKVLRRLERTGAVTAEALERGRASAPALKRDLLSVLVEMRLLDEEERTNAWREEMEEEIYELFVDRDATFEFRENQRPAGQGKTLDERYKLSGNGLIMEAARRIDEWGYIRQRVTSDCCVFEAAGGAESVPEEERDAALLEVLAALDGVRNATAVREATGLVRFAVCKKLAFLVDLRVIYEVPREVLLERARQCLHTERFREGLALLERAFELGADEPATHEMAALANRALHRIGECARHHTLVAQALERKGDRRAASEVYLCIRDLLPTDVHARERLVHHWVDDPAFFTGTKLDGATEFEELALILREIGRGEDALALLDDGRPRFSDDARAAVRFADLALELGHPRGAVEVLLQCGDALAARRQTAAALRLYRRVRGIDPGHDGLDGRIQGCEQRARPPAVTHASIARLVGFGVLLAGVAIALISRDGDAAAELARIETEELAIDGEFATALEKLEQFRAGHVLTVAAVAAERRIGELARRRDDHAAAMSRRQALIDSEKGRRQKGAERACAEARQAIERGDYVAAHAAFTRAAARATDAAFIDSERPGEKASELASYLATARQRRDALDAARAAGDAAEEHRLGALLWMEQPHAPQARGLELPVQITSEPSGALLELAGPGGFTAQATAPATVRLPVGAPVTIRARATDRFPLALTIAAEAQAALELNLDRRPEVEIEMPAAALGAPVIVGDRACFTCERGRLVCLKLPSLDLAWSRLLPELDEFVAPLELDGELLRAPTRRKQMVWFDPVTGDELGRQEHLSPPPRPPPPGPVEVVVADGWVRGTADGQLLLIRAGERIAGTWRSSAAVRWGVAAPDGSALFGDGARVLRVDPEAGAAAENRDKSKAGGGR